MSSPIHILVLVAITQRDNFIIPILHNVNALKDIICCPRPIKCVYHVLDNCAQSVIQAIQLFVSHVRQGQGWSSQENVIAILVLWLLIIRARHAATNARLVILQENV